VAALRARRAARDPPARLAAHLVVRHAPALGGVVSVNVELLVVVVVALLLAWTILKVAGW